MIIISYHPIKKEKQNEIDSVSKKKWRRAFGKIFCSSKRVTIVTDRDKGGCIYMIPKPWH